MQDFTSSIQNWFRQNGRNLPWRETSDPYRIWLSEIILQQTRVEQGMDYYHKFVGHYPTVEHLARASEDEVLNDWQGLGYYSRARNLHNAAKTIVEQHQGKFPSNYKDILDLKGVGDYTASAIASFAFNLPHAVVDGNVYRVISRYLNIPTPIDTTKGKKLFKEVATQLLDEKDPGTHNNAIMELGALVCTPKNPDCEHCPVQESCGAFAENRQLDLPVKSKKTKVRNRYFHYLILHHKGEILIKKRPAGDIWQGLYDFPLIEKDSKTEPDNKEMSANGVLEAEQDGAFKHILSHQHIHATFWYCEAKSIDSYPSAIKIRPSNIADYPLPKLLIRYLESSRFFNAD